jgi:hypothetical protein
MGCTVRTGGDWSSPSTYVTVSDLMFPAPPRP